MSGGDNIQWIDSLDDVRVASYRDLKDRELAARCGLFIVEGQWGVGRLLASGYTVESVLVTQRQLGQIVPLVPPGVDIYVAPAESVSRIVGFEFHCGVIACGRRRPPLRLDQAAELWAGKDELTLVVLPEVNSSENLGGLLRLSAGFGVDAVILGERCCDPFYRQAIRVSMGAVFHLNVVQCTNIAGDLQRLRERHGVQLAAAVLDETAQPLEHATRPPRFALLLGNEARGLCPEHINLCDRRVTIPMKLGTDSLNVTVAAGVFLYHFNQEKNKRG